MQVMVNSGKHVDTSMAFKTDIRGRVRDKLQRYEEHLNDAGVGLSADGSLKLEHNPAMYTTPNSDMGSGDEQSPYSVLNTILWGATNPMAQQTHGHGHLPV